MSTDFTGVLFPLVDLEEWCERHDFQLDTVECPICGNELYPDKPMATKEFRGYTYTECCDNTPVLFGAADPAERQRDREFAEVLYD